MSISTQEISKRTKLNLRQLPRDILGSQEAIAPAAGVVVRIDLANTWSGIGLDLDIVNAAGAAGAALIIIDKAKTITINAGERFTLSDVLYSLVEIQRAGAGAISVSVYYAGVSYELVQ